MNSRAWEDVPAERDGEMEAYAISPVTLSFEAAAVIGLCAVTIIGNALICVLGYRRPAQSNCSTKLLLTVAVSDICVAIVTMPLMVASLLELKWKYGDMLCKVSGVSTFVFISWSIFMLTLVSLQRWTLALCSKSDKQKAAASSRSFFWLFVVVVFLAGSVLCLVYLVDWPLLLTFPTRYLCRLANSPNYVVYRLFFCVFSLSATLAILILLLQSLPE